MTNRLWKTAIERVGAITAPLALDELPDAELLSRFVIARDECAFAAIVRRHGSLVWAVCRSLMHSDADAEDAFQATFLVLVRSANKVRKPNALGAWLHTVAGRVCRNGLRALTRRKRHERAAAISEESQPVDGAAWDRWQAIAHEEIDRLPESLRIAFVMCVVQGIRQNDAAERLGWRLGTVSGRVCRAKQSLADALTRRGLIGPAVLAVALGGSTAPLAAALANKGAIVSARNYEISKAIQELARGAMGGLMSTTKFLAAVVVIGTLAIGVGTKALSTADAQSAPPGAAGKTADSTPKAGPSAPGAPTGGGQMSPFGGSGAGSMSPSAPKVEYHFAEKPKSTGAFKKLLAEQGGNGWEYVGTIPGETELIFKRLQRAGGLSGMGGFGGAMGMPGMPGFPPLGGAGAGGGVRVPGPGMPPAPGGAAGPGFPGTPGAGFPMPPEVPGFPGAPGAGFPGSPGALPAGPGGVGGGPGAGGGFAPGAGATGTGGGARRSSTIKIQIGETIRYKMSSTKQIDRVLATDAKIAEVTLDLTDAKRVLIKGVAEGSTKLELTDGDGAKETYTIQVK